MPLIICPPYQLSKIYTAVLMYLDSTTNNSLVDLANGYNIPVPYVPQHFAISTEMAQSGTSSLKCSGNYEALYTTATEPFTFPGDYTLEFFFYPNRSQATVLFDIGGIINVNWQSLSVFTSEVDNHLYYSAFSNSSTGGSQAGTTIGQAVKSSKPYVLKTWNHLALIRSGNTHSMYLNGERVVTITSSLAPYAPTYPTIIGNHPDGGNLNFSARTGFDGYIDNFRVTKGVARYTGASFSVPATPFAKSAADPYWNNVSVFLDMETVGTNGVPVDAKGGASFNYVKVAPQTAHLIQLASPGGNTYSLRLDGGDASKGYLINENALLDFGTDDFTVEFWARSDVATGTYKTFFATRANQWQTADGFAIGIVNSSLYVYSDKFLVSTANGLYQLGRWNHIALVRKNGVMTLFINGSSAGTYSGSTYNFTQNKFAIGSNVNLSQSWRNDNTNSYMSGLRISNVARYDTNFVPSAASAYALD